SIPTCLGATSSSTARGTHRSTDALVDAVDADERGRRDVGAHRERGERRNRYGGAPGGGGAGGGRAGGGPGGARWEGGVGRGGRAGGRASARAWLCGSR